MGALRARVEADAVRRPAVEHRPQARALAARDVQDPGTGLEREALRHGQGQVDPARVPGVAEQRAHVVAVVERRAAGRLRVAAAAERVTMPGDGTTRRERLELLPLDACRADRRLEGGPHMGEQDVGSDGDAGVDQPARRADQRRQIRRVDDGRIASAYDRAPAARGIDARDLDVRDGGAGHARQESSHRLGRSEGLFAGDPDAAVAPPEQGLRAGVALVVDLERGGEPLGPRGEPVRHARTGRPGHGDDRHVGPDRSDRGPDVRRIEVRPRDEHHVGLLDLLGEEVADVGRQSTLGDLDRPPGVDDDGQRGEPQAPRVPIRERRDDGRDEVGAASHRLRDRDRRARLGAGEERRLEVVVPAAEAAARDLPHVLCRAPAQRRVDQRATLIVRDDRDTLTAVGQVPRQRPRERRLAGAEKAAEDVDLHHDSPLGRRSALYSHSETGSPCRSTTCTQHPSTRS